MHQGIAVHFRCGCDQEARALRQRQTEGIQGTYGVDLHDRNGDLREIHWAGRRCQVQHRVQRPSDVDVFRHIMFDEFKIRASVQVCDVVGIARDEIVHGDDAVPFGQQSIAQM